MRKAFFSLLCLIGLICMASTCSKSPVEDCSGHVCTMIFAMQQVHVQDSMGQLVTLDSTRTIVTATGQEISTTPMVPRYGNYILVDDGYHNQLVNKTEQVEFSGYQNGQVLVHGTYTISGDCCHVSKVSGPDTLIVK